MNEVIYIPILLFIIALLYSSIGHGGASSYIAVLSLFGISSSLIKPSALILNIFVASISFYYYYKNQHFKWKLFYPFALLSTPMAYIGSFITLNEHAYKQILGICLLVAVLRIMGIVKNNSSKPIQEPTLIVGIITGALLGLLSGAIGIGGGILLSPLILIFNWGTLKESAAVAALFIVVNSIAGIIGLGIHNIPINNSIFIWLIVAIIGGLIGAYWGSQKATNQRMKQVLASVLLIAAVKLIFI